MKVTLFGALFIAFYNEDFKKDKGSKSTQSVLKIVDWYDRDSKCFDIGGKKKIR